MRVKPSSSGEMGPWTVITYSGIELPVRSGRVSGWWTAGGRWTSSITGTPSNWLGIIASLATSPSSHRARDWCFTPSRRELDGQGSASVRSSEVTLSRVMPVTRRTAAAS